MRRTSPGTNPHGIALGYEDLNDHGELRGDAVLSLLVGKRDVTGEKRIRERDRGYALASASTLNRMELGEPEEAAHDRYKRIVAHPEAFDELLVELFVESHWQAPREIWLDLDATDDLLHGHQEGRFFHGYYGCYCYLPLYIFCGEHLLCARLRESNQDASAGSIEELERIVGQIRRHWPRTRINIRGDSGFCRDSLMKWCEEHGVGFVLGLARNQRLVRALGGAMHEAHSVHRRTGKAARRFRDFTYRTRKSWSCKRRVVGKAEYLSKGENPRFVVTNLSPRKAAARRLYEKLYCARGDISPLFYCGRRCIYDGRAYSLEPLRRSVRFRLLRLLSPCALPSQRHDALTTIIGETLRLGISESCSRCVNLARIMMGVRFLSATGVVGPGDELLVIRTYNAVVGQHSGTTP